MDVQVVDYHGGSLRVFARKSRETSPQTLVDDMIKKEEDFGLFDENTYKEFMRNLCQQRNNFLKEVCEIKLKGHPIVGVGAAAKGNTLLTFYKLDNSMLDYVTDSSEHKQGKYTPLTRIPITGDEIFAEYNEVYALVLAWNISDAIKENLKKINSKIKFLECKPI